MRVTGSSGWAEEGTNHTGTETKRRGQSKEGHPPAGRDWRLQPLFLFSSLCLRASVASPLLPALLTPPASVCYGGGLFALPSSGDLSVPRTILAFNGDLESRLALHWL